MLAPIELYHMLKTHKKEQENIIQEHYKMMRYELFHLLNIQASKETKLTRLTDLFTLPGEVDESIKELCEMDFDSIEKRMDEIQTKMISQDLSI